MGKARKTRKQKISADLHREFTYTLQPAQQQKHQGITPVEIITARITHHTNIPSTTQHTFIVKDLCKTAITTSFILAAQLLFSYSLKMHIISIPFMGLH